MRSKQSVLGSKERNCTLQAVAVVAVSAVRMRRKRGLAREGITSVGWRAGQSLVRIEASFPGAYYLPEAL